MTDTNTPRTAAIRKALGTGYVSWSRGDGWYATQGKDGVTYDEAEAAFKEAYAALDAIEAEAAHPDLLKIANEQWERGYAIGKAQAASPTPSGAAVTAASGVPSAPPAPDGSQAEAAAPTPADLPRTRGDGTVAYEPSDEPAAPLDVERLAYMFEHGIPRGAPPNPYTPEAKSWAMDYAKRFAAEYDRLAAARPDELDIDQLQQDGAQ